MVKAQIRTTIVQTNSMTSLIPNAIGISALSSGLNSNTRLLRIVDILEKLVRVQPDPPYLNLL